MSDIYTRLAATALSQINDKGRTVTLSTPGSDIYAPGSGTFTAGTPVTQTAKALFTEYSLRDIDGELIRTDDKECLIAASSLTGEPTAKDKIIDGSTEYSVVRVETVKPGDTALLYKIQVRR